MRYTRTFCLAAAISAAAFGLTACGAGAGSTKSVAASGSGSPVAAPSTATVAQAMALVTKQATNYTSMKMTMSEVAPKIGTITTSGSVCTRPLAMDLTVSNPQLAQALGVGSMQVLMSDDVMYMDMGSKGAQELGGKHWLKMSLASLGTEGQALTNVMNQSSDQGPATTVQLLTSSGDVKRVGQETVDGVPTTHYSGVVDTKKLLAQGVLPGSDDAELKTLLNQQAGLGLTTEDVDLWVNAQNLPVRAHETAQTSAGPLDVTVDYSDFSSSPLQITPPPAADTVDFSQLIKQEQQGQTG